MDNYDNAQIIEQQIAELTGAIKTSIQFEYALSDDELEFDLDMEFWRSIHANRQID